MNNIQKEEEQEQESTTNSNTETNLIVEDISNTIEMLDIDKSEYTKIPELVTVSAKAGSTSSNESILLNKDFQDLERQKQEKLKHPSSHLTDLEDLPQGRHLGLFSTIILFISRILGSGIFSITSGIYIDVGQSPFLFFLAWFLACIASFGGLYVFLEMGSLVPRSGGAKVFLEFIYTKPKLLATVAYSIYSVMFGFTISNVLVFGEYFVHSLGFEVTPFRLRLSGLLFLYGAALVHGVSVSHGVKVQNILGGLKLVLVGIMMLTGLYVMLLPQSITKLENNLTWDTFWTVKGSASLASFSSAVIKASFAFSGWNSVHTVSNEIKDPVKTLKIAGPVSLAVMTVTYFIINFAYLKVIPDEEIVNSSTLVGSVLFEKILGETLGRHFLTFSIALCAGGNIFVVIYTISRVDQEVFREGYLPFSKFMASNWPFGAPLRTLILSCSITTLIVVGFPKGDVYSYMVSLEGYPQQIAVALIAIGIYIIRKRYPDLHAPIKAGFLGTSSVFLISIYLIIGPFISSGSPNPKGLENWPNYASVGTICILICILYWAMMFKILPWFGNYELVSEEVILSDGLTIKQWDKIHNYSNIPYRSMMEETSG
ncbi:MUP3 [Candida pseudojiufengensis]|uniref:MUP3 n=1 Tax=Candida pseudojiufengensis TaxID=497109 RepID=UPI002224DC5A|nr:MUP3 [Candida pseudojiufengensis]KAI5966453.1 MUP3 [Candida pseudojiufengensis]